MRLIKILELHLPHVIVFIWINLILPHSDMLSLDPSRKCVWKYLHTIVLILTNQPFNSLSSSIF